MSRRLDGQVWGHVLLALGSVAAAAAAYFNPQLGRADEGVVLSATAGSQLREISWHDSSADVVVRRDDKDASIWVESRRPSGVAQSFPGNSLAQGLFERLGPLRATRQLAPVPADQLAAFGLQEAQKKLVLRGPGDTTYSLEVGSNAYGSGDAYARHADGPIVLLRAGLLSNLMSAGIGLQDREALGLSTRRFDQLTLQCGGLTRELVQRHSDAPEKAFMADPADPDRRLERATALVERLRRLRVVDLRDEPGTGAPALSAVFRRDRQKVVSLAIWPPADDGALATSSYFKQPIFLGRTLTEALLQDCREALTAGDAKP